MAACSGDVILTSETRNGFLSMTDCRLLWFTKDFSALTISDTKELFRRSLEGDP